MLRTGLAPLGYRRCIAERPERDELGSSREILGARSAHGIVSQNLY